MAERRRGGVAPVRRPGLSAPVVLASAMPVFAALLALGAWQVQRLQWKEGLNAAILERVEQPALPLDAVLAVWRTDGDAAYMPVRLRGSFIHRSEQHVLATFSGRSGWHVYTPLRLTDGRVAIVNRGFVPYELKDPATRSQATSGGAIEIVGLARNPPAGKPGFFVPDNAPGERTWYWKDFAGMAVAMGLEGEPLVPFFVDAMKSGGTAGAGPTGGVTRITLPNNHLQYAVTWYGLAAALAGVTGVFLWRCRERA